MHPAPLLEQTALTSLPKRAANNKPSAFTTLMAEGFVLLPKLMTAETLLAVRTELAPHFAATPKCVGDFHGWRTTRVNALLTKAPATRALVLDQKILAIAQRALKPSCDRIQLNLTQAIRVHPSERRQAPHRDEEMWPCDAKPKPWLINVMWALTDFTAENGATRLWPRSHLNAVDRDSDPAESVAGEMPAGSALIFLGSLTHGAGENRSIAPRDGVIVSYCLGWLRQYENQFLAYPPEIARTFPRRLQRLIGYQTHRPNLGFWEGQDPIRALSTKPGTPYPHVDALPPALVRQLKAHYGEEH